MTIENISIENISIENTSIIQNFVHLHLHTSNSRLDGMIEIPALMQHCKEHGMTAVAMTDHGNMSGAIEFYSEAISAGIKPIIGQEVYFVEDHLDKTAHRYHEGLLAMNNEGYHNLVRLSTLGFTEGLQRGYGTIDDVQIEKHNAGIICLSGCISGRLARTVLSGIRAEEEATEQARLINLYKNSPEALAIAKLENRRLATSAANLNGIKKTRTLEEASSMKTWFEQTEYAIQTGQTEIIIEELFKEARSIKQNSWAKAQQIIELRQSVFGDRYYLETQIIPLADQKLYNVEVRKLSELTGIPCVVTADAHYLKEGDAALHRLMLKIRTDKRASTKEKKVVKIEFPQDQSLAIMSSTGDANELESIYDSIAQDEVACLGKTINTGTKIYAQKRARWVQNAQIFYLQGSEAQVVEDDTASLDDIDPGRAFSDWLAEFWVRTPEEMLKAGAIPQEMQNTVDLAERVNVTLNLNSSTNRVVHMPKFIVPPSVDELGRERQWTPVEYLASLCSDALRAYLDEYPQLDEYTYRNRLEYELDVIAGTGFSEYFLIVMDYINHVKESGGLTGPGRGSAAASLVTFLLGITLTLDPLQYPDLMFERFLTPGRPDLPDIDTDFDDEARDNVFKYCQEKYGAEKVAKIGTFSQIGLRTALADIGRVIGISVPDVNQAKDVFKDYRPEDEDIMEDNRAMFSLEEVAKHIPELDVLGKKSPLHEEWFIHANNLQGTKRNSSQHASGVAIASESLVELGIPMMVAKSKTTGKLATTTQFDMDNLADLGIPKFDQLKLSSLSIIRETERIIGDDFEVANVHLDDKETYDALCRGDNLGIFQMVQNKVRGVMKQVKPRNLSDIAAIITIIRPGLIAKDPETGMTQEELFKARRQGKVPVTYKFKFLEPILNTTQGIMIYQEQGLKILWACGIDKLTADKIRKIMSKKKRSELLIYRAKFVPLAMEHQNLTEDEANHLWDLLEEFAGYSFNAAHAYTYGLIAYWTSYLKTHYPAAFLAASLSTQSEKGSPASKLLIPRLLEDCGQMGRDIPILSPSINHSQPGFSVEEVPTPNGLTQAIRFGLVGIKGVGSLSTLLIEERQKNGRFSSLEDIDTRMFKVMGRRPSRVALEALLYSGALDEFFIHRSEGAHAILIARTTTQIGKKKLEEEGWQPERAAKLAQLQAELCGNFYFVKNNMEVLGREVDNFFEAAKGDRITIGGRVIETKLYKTSRAGSRYHSSTIKTQWGDIKVDFFAPKNSYNQQDYLDKIRAKLFNGSVIFATGIVRDEKSMFGSSITLPKPEYRGDFHEDTKALIEEAEAILNKPPEIYRAPTEVI